MTAACPDAVNNDATPELLAAVQADDALLDKLGTSEAPDGTDSALARVLMVWRRIVDDESYGVLVSTDTALAVITAARK
jgi:hypothetical protein